MLLINKETGAVITIPCVPLGHKDRKPIIGEHKVSCPKCGGTDKECIACDGKGYNIVTFKDGRRIQ